MTRPLLDTTGTKLPEKHAPMITILFSVHDEPSFPSNVSSQEFKS